MMSFPEDISNLARYLKSQRMSVRLLDIFIEMWPLYFEKQTTIAQKLRLKKEAFLEED